MAVIVENGEKRNLLSCVACRVTYTEGEPIR